MIFSDDMKTETGSIWNLYRTFHCLHEMVSLSMERLNHISIEQEKDLLPLLLDATPLPADLGRFQWIDFRGTVGPNHLSIDSHADEALLGARQRPVAPRARWRVSYALAGLATATAVVSGIVLTTLSMPRSDAGHPVDSLPPPAPPLLDLVPISGILVLLGGVGALGAFLLWLRHRGAKRGGRTSPAREHPGHIERRVAVELEAEILRRTASAPGMNERVDG